MKKAIDMIIATKKEKKQLNSHENVVFIGSSGTGKTHLSIALAIKALARDHSVYFTTVSDLLYNLHMAKADKVIIKN